MTLFKPCIVIPNFNHARGFPERVEQMLSYGLALIVINDGSNAETRAVLEQLAREHADVEVVHFLENSGKGAAVIAGLRHAAERGFSHALQIDADGQHDLQDMHKFLTLSAAQTDAVICGQPVYDHSVPTHRLLARYITHFWVWVETLSFSIKDSMCGFRVYPLAAVLQILDHAQVGTRMDFDIEILVRLYWNKIPLHFVPTKVIYPVNGMSNFKLYADNWLISKMHVRLLAGMLVRIPQLVMRSRAQKNQDHWSSISEKGSAAGMKLMFWIYRHLGRWLFLLMLHPVILYFLLSASSARKASRQYLQQVAAYKSAPAKISFSTLYAHFYSFGVSIVDKLGSWCGKIKRSDVIIHDAENFNAILASGRGAVFIGSHLGNLELSRALGEKHGRFKINAVVFNKNAIKFQSVLRSCAPDVELNLIHVETISIDTAIILKQKVDAGEIVIIVGDRTSRNSTSRVHYADFLGRKAPFAEGPFILASILECPVYLIFCIKEAQTYNIYLEPFAATLKFPRAERRQKLEQKIEEYAKRLAYYCLKSPLQWFNFYDFWGAESDARPSTGAREIK